MSGRPIDAIRGYLRRYFSVPVASSVSDRQLLEQFAVGGNQAAFALIVQRHGPLVLGVCRRVLGDSDDAADAFQATFLVLLQKAGSLRWHDSVAGWLYEVASRITQKTRARAGRPAPSSLMRSEVTAEDPVADASRRELRSILDEEILRLPEKYRTPLILHYFQG
jgi:RNA polymerase sigma factor (sigma-70 family)